MYKKKLSWQEIVAARIPFEDFYRSVSILRSLANDDGEYLAFNRFEDNHKRGTTGAGVVDRIDSGDPVPVSINNTWRGREEYCREQWAIVPKSAFKSETESQPEPNSQAQGEQTMSQTQQSVAAPARRVVIIELIDNDPGLDVEHSLVARYDGIVTEDCDATTIQELIMNRDIAGKVRKHNAKRAEQVDLDVQKRTGNTVNLQPVKLKDLTWNVK